MVNKFEALGIGLSIGAMVLALWLVRVNTATETITSHTPQDSSAAVYVSDIENQRAALADAIIEASDDTAKVQRIIIDDIVLGTGKEVASGDTVTVHYIGTLQSGQQFDNSYVKGQPFTFTVGAGKVIQGWDEGILGMQEGGQRILVVPSHAAYGEQGYGPIPGNATLVFAIELLSIE